MVRDGQKPQEALRGGRQEQGGGGRDPVHCSVDNAICISAIDINLKVRVRSVQSDNDAVVSDYILLTLFLEVPQC